jgi:hypothetical protein
MTIKVIGAGIGRTGTTSLQAALETLLGGRCYHMLEVFSRPDDIPQWAAAARGDMPDWPAFLQDFSAAVDWPASAFWPEIAAAFPDALIVLSTRRDAETWWRSASATIFPTTAKAEPGPWLDMITAMFKNRFTEDVQNKAAAIAAYEAHNAFVRKTAPAARLLEWQAEDGWAPLCTALSVAVPSAPFPHANTTADFKAGPAAVRDSMKR